MSNRREHRKGQRQEQKKKPRFVGLKFSLDDISKDELQSLKIGVSFNGKWIEANIRTDKRAITTYAVKGYRKEGKPSFNLKKTNFISNTRQMEVIPNLGNFDTLVAIDTNTLSLSEPSYVYHVGAAAQISTTIEEGKPVDYAEIIKVFSFDGQHDKPENYNWKNLIEFIRRHPNYLLSKNYRINVDSDLGNIPNFNTRTFPIIDDFYLPPNFQLIYASSDAANDEITNQALAFCDKVSKKALDQIKEDIRKELRENQGGKSM